MAETVFFIMLVVVVPAMIGFYMAKKRGKNPFLWGLLSICPFAIYILKVQFKPLDKKDDKAL
jgi:hypothetical protein